jgi:hypothetical protein
MIEHPLAGHRYIVQLIFWKNIGNLWQREAKKPAE